ncbi:MAG: imidazolonepropionase [Clostridia bacterium]|nr:imidazolonepropionase [Clostridia bacterium]
MSKLILTNISELVTCRGNAPKCGKEMSELGIIRGGCVVIENGLILEVGKSRDILRKHNKGTYRMIDCSNNAVLPGFIDSHTHFVFGGYRQDEFAMRLSGASYMEILESGGGITNTVKSTRKATIDELVEEGMKRAYSMLSFGVTTAEGKSGYGLDKDTEIKQLKVMKEINEEHPIDIVPTFLGAHSVPPEFKGRKEAFLNYLISHVLPDIKEKELAGFVDIFCEKGVFDIEQSRRYLRKAKEMGFKLKLHADEITGIGGAELGVELKAVSADHLLQASDVGIVKLAESGVIATLLPATAFCLKEKYADARKMIDAGCAVSLASDFNPGSCFTNSIPLVIALAAIQMQMSNEEIVSALTINGACALDRQDSIGSIEKGKLADILILKYPSVNFLSYNIGMNIVKTVIKKGEIIY